MPPLGLYASLEACTGQLHAKYGGIFKGLRVYGLGIRVSGSG